MPQRAATIAEVRVRLGASFTDPPITDAVVQLYLDDTACFIDPPTWGDCASQAHAYAAAHCIAGSPEGAGIGGAAGQAQILSGATDGPASYSFAVPTQTEGDSPWSLTSWGRKFLEYRKVRHGTGSALVARTSRSARRSCF